MSDRGSTACRSQCRLNGGWADWEVGTRQWEHLLRPLDGNCERLDTQQHSGPHTLYVASCGDRTYRTSVRTTIRRESSVGLVVLLLPHTCSRTTHRTSSIHPSPISTAHSHNGNTTNCHTTRSTSLTRPTQRAASRRHDTRLTHNTHEEADRDDRSLTQLAHITQPPQVTSHTCSLLLHTATSTHTYTHTHTHIPHTSSSSLSSSHCHPRTQSVITYRPHSLHSLTHSQLHYVASPHRPVVPSSSSLVSSAQSFVDFPLV